MSKQTQKTILDVITYTLLILGSVVMVGPFFWMVSTAFNFQQISSPEP